MMNYKALAISCTAAALSTSAYAATITIDDLQPSGAQGGSLTTFVTTSQPGSLAVVQTLGNAMNTATSDASVTYQFTLSNVTVDELTNATVVFDLTVTAAGDATSVNYQHFNSSFVGWTANGASGSATRLNGAEALQFTLGNAKINGTDASLTNVAFSDVTAGSGITISTAGLLEANGGSSHVKGFDVSFDISPAAVPEPSSAALIGIGSATLLLRRRR